MRKRHGFNFTQTVFLVFIAVGLSSCFFQNEQTRPRMSFFVGVDASGSFKNSGNYESSLSFLAYYIYGHLNQLGGMAKPRELFVGSIGGKQAGETKSFHPIHDFEGKSVEEIEFVLREWFPPTDTHTDFNAFFREVGRIAKSRNLTLAPITVMVVTDGIPDSNSGTPKSKSLYQDIDLGPMEYLSRNLTLRVAYPTPTVSEQWRKHVKRQRVRLWTVDGEVMKGWRNQVSTQASPDGQDKLWKWVKDNVDYRVRSRPI